MLVKFTQTAVAFIAHLFWLKGKRQLSLCTSWNDHEWQRWTYKNSLSTGKTTIRTHIYTYLSYLQPTQHYLHCKDTCLFTSSAGIVEETASFLCFCADSISQLPNKFHGHCHTPRVCNFIDLLISWVRSYTELYLSDTDNIVLFKNTTLINWNKKVKIKEHRAGSRLIRLIRDQQINEITYSRV